MAGDDRVKAGGGRIDVECGDIVNDIKDRGTDLENVRLGNTRCPRSFVIVATNGSCRGDRRQFLDDPGATDVSRMNDVVASCKGRYCFGPKQAMSVGDQPDREFSLRHERPLANETVRRLGDLALRRRPDQRLGYDDILAVESGRWGSVE